MWKIILVILLFLILAGLFVYQNFLLNKDSNDSGTDNDLMRVGENAIYVSDQKPGSSVIIGLVFMGKAGYVIIYNNNDGQPGEIIGGTRLLPEGETKGATANLIKPSVHGEELIAIIHEETSDGIFSPNLDTPFRDDRGDIVFMRFKIDQRVSELPEINL